MISTTDLIAQFQYAIDNKWGYIYGTAGEQWTAAKQAQATRKQTIEYGRQWIGHMVADCSGLFTWAFKQLGGYMYHGSNTMYKSYCTDKGRMDGRELKPGTAVFTGTEDNHGHVGLYIGNGVVIEAAGTKQGVITSKLSNTKWTYWGELKGVDYSGEPTPATKPVLRKGDKGPYVKEMQQDLLDHGYDLGKWGADGSFGNATEAALKAFQKDHGLVADGICGQRTWDALEETETKLYTVTIPHCTKYQTETLQSQYPGAIITEE